MDTLMTEKELATRLRVSRSTLWQLRTSNQIPFLTIRHSIRYDADQIQEWIKTVTQSVSQEK